MSTIKLYNSSTSGYVRNTSLTSWSDTRDAITGNNSGTDAQSLPVAAYRDTFYQIFRSFFYFDTSEIPDTATITSAKLYMYAVFTGGTAISVCEGTQSDTLANEDFDSYSGSEYGHITTNTSAYVALSFNAQGISDINKSGVTKLCLRDYTYDYLNATPTGGDQYSIYTAQYSDESKRMYLEIEYETESTPTVGTKYPLPAFKV